MLQGSWLIDMAFLIYQPIPSFGVMDLAEPENVMVGTLIFAWHMIVCMLGKVPSQYYINIPQPSHAFQSPLRCIRISYSFVLQYSTLSFISLLYVSIPTIFSFTSC